MVKPQPLRAEILDPWVIEEIRKREEEDRNRQQSEIRIEIPAPQIPIGDQQDDDDPEKDRGITKIDYFLGEKRR